MIRDAAVAEIKQAFGFRKSLDAVCVTALINSQQEMEKLPVLPWFLETEDEVSSTTAPVVDASGSLTYEDRVPLPADFLREKEDCYLKILHPNSKYYVDLVKKDADYITKGVFERQHYNYLDYPNSTFDVFRPIKHGIPAMYAISSNYFRVRPYPDDVYNLQFRYYKKDGLLTDNVENLWLYHFPYLLIGRSIVRVASATRDQEAVALGNQMQQDALQSMIQETESRESTNRRYAMGQDV